MSIEPEPRRRLEPVHGVHYLTDYYSVLGVERTATETAIRSARNSRIMQYHPDRLQGLAPELQARALSQTRIINEASAMLLRPEVKQKYDRMLGDWTGLISPDGTPVMSVDDFFLNLETGTETRTRIDGNIKQAEIMTGYNPMLFDMVEKQFLATDNPPPELRAMYLDLLYKQQVDITLKEEFRRGALGIKMSDSFAPPLALAAEAQDLIAQRREQVGTEIERQTHAALQAGEIKALTAPAGMPDAVMDDTSTTLAVLDRQQEVLETFDQISAEIVDFATQREAIIAKRLDLSRGEYLPGQEGLSDKLIVAYVINGKKTYFAFNRVDETRVDQDNSLTNEDYSLAEDPEKAKQLYERGYSVMTVTHQEGLPLLEDMRSAIQEHYSELDKQNEGSKG